MIRLVFTWHHFLETCHITDTENHLIHEIRELVPSLPLKLFIISSYKMNKKGEVMYYTNIRDFERLGKITAGDSSEDEVVFFTIIGMLAILIVSAVSLTN